MAGRVVVPYEEDEDALLEGDSWTYLAEVGDRNENMSPPRCLKLRFMQPSNRRREAGIAGPSV